jgi:hypothetical protein
MGGEAAQQAIPITTCSAPSLSWILITRTRLVECVNPAPRVLQ